MSFFRNLKLDNFKNGEMATDIWIANTIISIDTLSIPVVSTLSVVQNVASLVYDNNLFVSTGNTWNQIGGGYIDICPVVVGLNATNSSPANDTSICIGVNSECGSPFSISLGQNVRIKNNGTDKSIAIGNVAIITNGENNICIGGGKGLNLYSTFTYNCHDSIVIGGKPSGEAYGTYSYQSYSICIGPGAPGPPSVKNRGAHAKNSYIGSIVIGKSSVSTELLNICIGSGGFSTSSAHCRDSCCIAIGSSGTPSTSFNTYGAYIANGLYNSIAIGSGGSTALPNVGKGSYYGANCFEQNRSICIGAGGSTNDAGINNASLGARAYGFTNCNISIGSGCKTFNGATTNGGSQIAIGSAGNGGRGARVITGNSSIAIGSGSIKGDGARVYSINSIGIGSASPISIDLNPKVGAYCRTGGPYITHNSVCIGSASNKYNGSRSHARYGIGIGVGALVNLHSISVGANITSPQYSLCIGTKNTNFLSLPLQPGSPPTPYNVTQITSINTNVNLNATSGSITLFDKIVAGDVASFLFTNDKILSTSIIQLSSSDSTTNVPLIVGCSSVLLNNVIINIYNPTGSDTDTSPKIYFTIFYPAN